MDYGIVATLGPTSNTETLWRQMLSSGVTAFRLNTSHLTLSQLREWLDRLVPFLTLSDSQYPLILDLQGSKWRLGNLQDQFLHTGQKVRLINDTAADADSVLPVPHADFFRAAQDSSGEIVLNDAKVSLVLEAAGSDWITSRVVRGGPISANKGITFTASNFRQESLNEKDQLILAETYKTRFVRYAISYVKDGIEMASYRALFEKSYLIAKLERPQALSYVDQVARSADELWLCRGDLGAELGLAAMAQAAHQFARYVPQLPVPTFLAGQVLEHMTVQPTPTRSEVCAMYDALKAGYHGFVLSDETAVGRYPAEACQAARIFKDEKPLQSLNNQLKTLI